MSLPQLLASRGAFFALGAAAASALGSSPLVRETVRTLVRKTVKGGLVLKDQVQTMTEKLREDLQDIVAEAQAEIEADKSHTQEANGA